jgi:hypothetical protein
MLCTRIREALGSNLGRNTGYTGWGSSWISLVPPGNCRDSTRLEYNRSYLKSFLIHQSSNHSMLCSPDTDCVVEWLTLTEESASFIFTCILNLEIICSTETSVITNHKIAQSHTSVDHKFVTVVKASNIIRAYAGPSVPSKLCACAVAQRLSHSRAILLYWYVVYSQLELIKIKLKNKLRLLVIFLELINLALRNFLENRYPPQNPGCPGEPICSSEHSITCVLASPT